MWKLVRKFCGNLYFKLESGYIPQKVKKILYLDQNLFVFQTKLRKLTFITWRRQSRICEIKPFLKWFFIPSPTRRDEKDYGCNFSATYVREIHLFQRWQVNLLGPSVNVILCSSLVVDLNQPLLTQSANPRSTSVFDKSPQPFDTN